MIASARVVFIVGFGDDFVLGEQCGRAWSLRRRSSAARVRRGAAGHVPGSFLGGMGERCGGAWPSRRVCEAGAAGPVGQRGVDGQDSVRPEGLRGDERYGCRDRTACTVRRRIGGGRALTGSDEGSVRHAASLDAGGGLRQGAERGAVERAGARPGGRRTIRTVVVIGRGCVLLGVVGVDSRYSSAYVRQG